MPGTPDAPDAAELRAENGRLREALERLGLLNEDKDAVIADNASAAGYLLGGRATEPGGVDLRLTGLVLEKNGELAATAAGAAVLGHPAAAVAWLARVLHGRGRGLEAGQVIMAGALTEALPVAPGDVIVAHFDRLGSVELACR